MSLEQLRQLRRIRNRRMEKQYTIVQEHRRQVEGYERQLQEAHERLKQFQQERLARQDAYFRELQSQPFTPEAMREYQTKVQQLVSEEEFHAQQIPECEKKLENAKQAFEKCQKESNQLTLQHEKMKEIIEVKSNEELQVEEEPE